MVAEQTSETQPLRGQQVVITGGGRGIGAAVALELGRLGGRITLLGRTSASLERQRAELEARFDRPVGTVVVDLTQPDSVEQAFASLPTDSGPPSILVNNAGTARGAPFTRTDLSLWQEMLGLNLTGAYLCIRQVLPAMLEAGYGRIVNVASTAGLVGYRYVSAYCASKHGLIGLTRALALETARSGVTVNAVCPGYTDTDLTSTAIERISQQTSRAAETIRAELVRNNPLGRLIQPSEVAQAVGWLCLPSSAAITGQSIVVAGGEVT
jgi:NAD(P)-dependent dehydrogenase (short-subunit alcohol dehydrogenase family)